MPRPWRSVASFATSRSFANNDKRAASRARSTGSASSNRASTRVAVVGQLSGALAHELNQPLTAILSNAQAAQRFLKRDSVDLDEVRAIIDDIVSDDKRAGEVIRRLRALLKLRRSTTSSDRFE